MRKVLVIIDPLHTHVNPLVSASRLSFSKNGVIRMDGFSTPDQFDDEALALWDPGVMQESHLDRTTAKYILSFIGDKFCQMVLTENTAASSVKKDGRKPRRRFRRSATHQSDPQPFFQPVFSMHVFSQAGVEASGEGREGDVRRLRSDTLQHPLGLSEMRLRRLPGLLQGQGEKELQRLVLS